MSKLFEFNVKLFSSVPLLPSLSSTKFYYKRSQDHLFAWKIGQGNQNGNLFSKIKYVDQKITKNWG